MLPFMFKLWHYLNTTKFHGAMKEPRLALLKTTAATSFKMRACWRPAQRELAMSPRMFNGSQGYFVETMLHEMCHQAVSEIDQYDDSKENGGHGSHWAHWMKKVGLNPLRYDKNRGITYMSPQEKEERDHHVANRVPLTLEDLRCGTKASMISKTTGHEYLGLFMGSAPGKGWLFYFVPKAMSGKVKFYWANKDTISNYSRASDPKGKLNNPRWRANFAIIMKHLYGLNNPSRPPPSPEELAEYIKSISSPREG